MIFSSTEQYDDEVIEIPSDFDDERPVEYTEGYGYGWGY